MEISSVVSTQSLKISDCSEISFFFDLAIKFAFLSSLSSKLSKLSSSRMIVSFVYISIISNICEMMMIELLSTKSLMKIISKHES